MDISLKHIDKLSYSALNNKMTEKLQLEGGLIRPEKKINKSIDILINVTKHVFSLAPTRITH